MDANTRHDTALSAEEIIFMNEKINLMKKLLTLNISVLLLILNSLIYSIPCIRLFILTTLTIISWAIHRRGTLLRANTYKLIIMLKNSIMLKVIN